MAETERTYEVYVDLATGLYDRRTMWSRLAEEISRAHRYHYPFSLLLVAFNTPEAGQSVEHVLLLADMLKKSTRTSDILARYSEDTLAILLPCTDERGALLLAERIRQMAMLIPLPPPISGGLIPVSIALTSAPGGYGGDKIALVEQLEWALRKAQKKGGGNRTVVVSAPSPNQPAQEPGK